MRSAHDKVLRQSGVQHEGGERHGPLRRGYGCSRVNPCRCGRMRRKVLLLLRICRHADLPAGGLRHLLKTIKYSECKQNSAVSSPVPPSAETVNSDKAPLLLQRAATTSLQDSNRQARIGQPYRQLVCSRQGCL